MSPQLLEMQSRVLMIVFVSVEAFAGQSRCHSGSLLRTWGKGQLGWEHEEGRRANAAGPGSEMWREENTESQQPSQNSQF